jgi:hypothetical protein
MKQSKAQTPTINITAGNGFTLGVLEPLECVECFNLKAFGVDLDRFPFSPVGIWEDGSTYSHNGCKTEEDGIRSVMEHCQDPGIVFVFLMEREKIKYGWFFQKVND